MRSVKRVSKQLNKSSEAQQLFTTLGYAILYCKSEDGVKTLFDVLHGARKIEAALEFIPENKRSVIREYASKHKAEAWKPATHWCQWWMRSCHLHKS